MDVIAVHIDGDIQVAQCVVKGTTKEGITSTFHGTSIGRIKDDQIVEGWNYFDFLTMYKQLGMIEQVAAQ